MSSTSASKFSTSYAFTVCNAGSEKILKADVEERHEGRFRPAFMRPQLITWKSSKPLTHGGPASIFARVSGLSVGLFKEMEKLAEALAAFQGTALHLHVFPREVPEDGFSAEEWSQLGERASLLGGQLRAAGVMLHDAHVPLEGEWVLDVILDADANAQVFAGVHRHGPDCRPYPGGVPRVSLPDNVPSRAWLKLEQGLAFAGLDVPGLLRGKVALELGCAPGGASLALLQHGVSVFGVDTATMDDRVRSFRSPEGARFVHLAMNAGDIPAALLPKHVDLLVCDLNLAPPVVLRIVEKLQAQVHASVFVLTLKLNDSEMVTRIPQFLKTLRRFAPAPLRATQLPANRSEFCVIAGRI